VTVAKEFVAAYDASGSENDRKGALVVVGLVSHEHKWNRFEEEWAAVLHNFDVPYFHMKELNHRHSGKGIYAKWKDDDVQPRRFVEALVKTLRRGVNKTFVHATVLQDYEEVNRRFKLREQVGSPYVLTTGSCYNAINLWLRSKYPDSRIVHFVEKGDCGQRDLHKLMKQQNRAFFPLDKIDPQTGKRWIPFQGSDLVAGAYRSAANKFGRVQKFEEYGELFGSLARTLPQTSRIRHKANLLEMCRDHPDKFPKRAQ
jgi:hypothetical protein